MFAIPSVRVSEPLASDRLTVFPLFLETPKPACYRLAEDALADGTVVVQEVDEFGSVPQLTVVNHNDTLVLFLEGQELRGAKQNRVLNTSVLIAAKCKTQLPVSCVEQGRWRQVSKQFSGSDNYSSSKLRSVLKGSVSRATRAGEGHHSDQHAVWEEVSRQMRSLGTESPTGAMADTYEAHRSHVDKVRAEVPYAEGAAGLAVAIGGKLVSIDLFDAPETCRKVWPRLVGGVALDALEEREAATVSVAEVAAALNDLRAMQWQPVPPAGAGEEHRVEVAGRWYASALTLGGRMVHVSMVTC